MAKRILIIEDEEDIVEMTRMRLESCGFQVEAALAGNLGLEKAITFKPDLILLDIIMPDIDGWEVCRRLRAHPATKETPVIILTAAQSTQLEKNVKEVGANQVVLKPFNDADLIDIIKKFF